MKKITISIALLTTMLTTKAQDTICTMIKPSEVIEFNYQTSKVIERENYKGIVFIEVKNGEVLCLHLYDKVKRKRKITITYHDGEQVVQRLDSKDNVYYSQIGPLTVEIK
tara:strand:+ start:410 stop:739 length:330 start_codon:yes stop_codon:yes gene_type:complete